MRQTGTLLCAMTLCAAPVLARDVRRRGAARNELPGGPRVPG